MSICIRYTGNSDRAKENLNLGFYRILKYLKTYKTEEPFKPWIRKVMINTLIKEFKKEKNHNLNLVYVEDYYDAEKYSEMNTIMEKINSEKIRNFIALLPDSSRQVFNLYFIDGYKHREIAETKFKTACSFIHLAFIYKVVEEPFVKLKDKLDFLLPGKKTVPADKSILADPPTKG